MGTALNEFQIKEALAKLPGWASGDDSISKTFRFISFPEAIGFIAEMAFAIDKVTVTAISRALKAEYTTELAQDLKAVHGLDAESELANILSAEILGEINREVIRTNLRR